MSSILLIIIWCIPAQAGRFGKMCNFFGRELGKSIGSNLQKDIDRTNRELKKEWKKERRKIQKETCQLLKDNLIKRRYKKEDLEDIRDFITSRLPKGKKKGPYISIIEEIGYKLIDNDLTIVDYEIIEKFIERIARTWSKRPWYEELFYRLGDNKKPGASLIPSFSQPIGF
jgi:hypothetical protein